MNRIVGCAILIVVATAFIGGDATSLLNLFILILILGAALYMIFRHRMPKRFLENLLFLLFGPMILIFLISHILGNLSNWQFEMNWLLALLVVLLIAYSWYGWRRWQGRRQGNRDQYALRGSEREFVVPYHDQTIEQNNLTVDDEP